MYQVSIDFRPIQIQIHICDIGIEPSISCSKMQLFVHITALSSHKSETLGILGITWNLVFLIGSYITTYVHY